MKRYILFFLPLLLFTSCIDEDELDNDPRGNFEALWKIMDEHYCFFKEKNVDWNAVHAKYAQQIDNSMTESQTFEVLTHMLSELRDGHVNLYTSFDVGRYWAWHEDYPSNVSDTLIRRYLGTDYRIASGLRYRILDDNVAYVRCTTFENALGDGNLDQMLLYLAPCKGLILDLRGNNGGRLTSAEQLAARFCNEKTKVGYMRHKTGKGHDDFSSLETQYIKPSKGVRWQKPVVVLANREVYSAANEFVKYMKVFPKCTVVGDSTGGGGGLPFSSELPNGWAIRYSACPMYDVDYRLAEPGVAPDEKVSLSQEDFNRGLDTIIEYARRLLSQGH